MGPRLVRGQLLNDFSLAFCFERHPQRAHRLAAWPGLVALLVVCRALTIGTVALALGWYQQVPLSALQISSTNSAG